MKTLKLTEQQIDFLNGLLTIEEDKLLNRLDRRVDVEENNIAKLNIVRELMNTIYLLDEEKNKKQKDVGLNLEDDSDVDIITFKEMLEKEGMSMDYFFSGIHEREILEAPEEFAESFIKNFNEELQEDEEDFRLDLSQSVIEIVEYLEGLAEKEDDSDIDIGDEVQLVCDLDEYLGNEDYLGTIGIVTEIDGENLILDCGDLGMCQANISEVRKIK